MGWWTSIAFGVMRVMGWMVEELFEDAWETTMQENTGTPFGGLHCGRESLGNRLKKVRIDKYAPVGFYRLFV